MSPPSLQADHWLTSFGQHLKTRFGVRVRKLSLHAGFTCPNRDGTLGRGGCSFCSVLSFNGDDPTQTIAEQIKRGKAATLRAERYLAYFQAYTSTYAELDRLQHLYAAALAEVDMVGICVGTRPDCVPDAVLQLLAGYRAQGYEVWLELGLQSAHDATLATIRRGHDFAAYCDAVRRARALQIPVCTHLILGLPGETAVMMLDSHRRVIECGVEGLKLHPLMIVKGSRMASQHARGEIQPLTLDAYADCAAELICRTPPEVVFHRITATARAPMLIAPQWCEGQWPSSNAIVQRLAQRGGQGSQR